MADEDTAPAPMATEEQPTEEQPTDPDTSPPEEWGQDISPNGDGQVFKKILKEGEGDESPMKGNEVYVHYTGRLLDGTVFDSSVDRKEIFNFKLGQGSVIKGWDVGVATMKKGEKCLLTCKPDFAYGKSGAGDNIPPDSTLQFEVELFHWDGEDVTGDEGVVMFTLKEGTGYRTPTDGSTVKVHIKGMYESKIIEDRDVEFDLGEGSESSIIEGIEKALAKMKEKEECRLVIQPGYAYGASGNETNGVPPNAVVTYWVTLDSFIKAKSSYEYDDVKDRITDSTALKEKGSKYFKESKFPLALKLYERGLGLVDKTDDGEATKEIRLILLLNAALCQIKLNLEIEARDNCDKVIEEDPSNVKAHFRRGQSYQLMQDYDEALKCFQEVVKLDAKNRSAVQQAQVCRQKIRQQLEKDKKMYASMFKGTLSTEDDEKKDDEKKKMENGDVKEDSSPVKDTIAQAVEEEEKESAPVEA